MNTLYWLTDDEYTLGIYSELDKAKEGARRHLYSNGIFDEMQWTQVNVEKPEWRGGGYTISMIQGRDIDHDLFP